MLIDALDEIAEAYGIPDEIHDLLHVNSRESWKDLVAAVIDSGTVKPNKKTIDRLARNWETILCNRYSLMN